MDKKRLTSNSTSNPNNEVSVIKIRPAEQSQWMFCFSLQDMVRCKLGVNVGPAGKTKVANTVRASKSQKKKNSKNNHTERFCYYVKTHVRLLRLWYSRSRLIKLQFVLKLFKNTAHGTVVRRDVDRKQHI